MGKYNVYNPYKSEVLQGDNISLGNINPEPAASHPGVKPGDNQFQQNRKIFISHSSKDRKYVEKFVELLESMGLKNNQMFCSSVPGYTIPLGKDIYDYLREEFTRNKLFVIYMLSENYYKSPACLNEMGAAWVLQTTYQSILLPGFSYKEINGAINPRTISLVLDNEETVNYRLNELKDNILKEFGLSVMDVNVWERKRNNFIKSICEMQAHLAHESAG